jgi:hypothetical protein
MGLIWLVGRHIRRRIERAGGIKNSKKLQEELFSMGIYEGMKDVRVVANRQSRI